MFNLKTPYGEVAKHDLTYTEAKVSAETYKVGEDNVPYFEVKVSGKAYITQEENQKEVQRKQRELEEKEALAQKDLAPEIAELQAKVDEINLQQ